MLDNYHFMMIASVAQQDYRWGLLLIMAPPEVAQQFDPLCAKYDFRSFSYCPTHISVSDPLRREKTSELEKEIRSILSGIEPFTLYYEKPHILAERAGVSCAVTPQEPIDHLNKALHTAAVFAGQVYQRRHIPAHITIAEFISIEDSLKIRAQLQATLPSGSFLCDKLSFIVPDEDFKFQRKGVFPLGNT